MTAVMSGERASLTHAATTSPFPLVSHSFSESVNSGSLNKKKYLLYVKHHPVSKPYLANHCLVLPLHEVPPYEVPFHLFGSLFSIVHSSPKERIWQKPHCKNSSPFAHNLADIAFCRNPNRFIFWAAE